MLVHSYAYSYLFLGGEGEKIFLSHHSKLSVSEKVAHEKHFWSPAKCQRALGIVKFDVEVYSQKRRLCRNGAAVL